MESQFNQAFDVLKSLDVPVYVHADDNGNFSISAPSEDVADYWAAPSNWVFGVHPDIDEILREHGLFAEWVNPERLAVYKI